jgi:predicted PurR-regulated permease PerM
MVSETSPNRPLHMLFAAAAFVVVIAGLRAAEAILIPFLLALFIAIICTSPTFWLQRKGVPTFVAVLLMVFAILAVEMLFVALLGTSIDSFIDNLPFYQRRLKEEAGAVLRLITHFGLSMPDRSMVELVDPGAAMRLIANMLTGLGGVLTNTFLILITVIFMLLEAAGFPAKLEAAFGSLERSAGYLRQFTSGIRRYLAMKTVVSLATGVSAGSLVFLLDIDFPILWGVLAFLFNYVPNIGSIIAALPAVLLAYIQFGLFRALVAAAGYVLINVIFGNVVEPRLMGRGLGLSTLVVFVSLVFWGWVLGPVGMLLSVPLTMTAKIALDSHPETRWLAVLLGPEAAARTLTDEGDAA